MAEVYQAKVHFTGRVQGVGFRWTTERIAARFAVTGRVRNLTDGRVWLLAEGDKGEVGKFIQEIRHVMRDNISDVEFEEASAEQQYGNFGILR